MTSRVRPRSRRKTRPRRPLQAGWAAPDDGAWSPFEKRLSPRGPPSPPSTRQGGASGNPCSTHGRRSPTPPAEGLPGGRGLRVHSRTVWPRDGPRKGTVQSPRVLGMPAREAWWHLLGEPHAGPSLAVSGVILVAEAVHADDSTAQARSAQPLGRGALDLQSPSTDAWGPAAVTAGTAPPPAPGTVLGPVASALGEAGPLRALPDARPAAQPALQRRGSAGARRAPSCGPAPGWRLSPALRGVFAALSSRCGSSSRL